MNNCRAGLYSFASTTAWLHSTGVASPPLLVMLGLTLPDSRILNGIASIGLTLANIAIILPHLRQPTLDSVHAVGGVLAHGPGTKEQITLSLDKPCAAYSVDAVMECPVLAPGSPSRRERQGSHLICSSTIKLVRTADTEPLEFEVALPPRETGQTDGDIPPNIPPSLCADSSVSSGNLFSREGRGALYIPLPVPDAEEVAFFDTECATFSDSDPGEACEQYIAPEEYSLMEDYETTAEEGIEQDNQLDTTNLSRRQERVQIGKDYSYVAMPVVQERIASRAQSPHATHSLTARKEASAKRRPESLEFIPQSVIRRYPSVPMVLAGHSPGFNFGHDHQVSPAPPFIFAHNPAKLLEGARPRVSYTTLPRHWGASFVTEVQPTKRWMGQTLAIEAGPAQDPLKQGPASLPDPPSELEPTPRGNFSTHKRRLGVLARAALRNRRFTARRRKDGEDDGSSTSGSDSDFDNDSQYSSESSASESMLPHMLGADLIAAIDANSESGLNLVGSKRKMRTPLNVYEDYLVSEDSEAGVSIIMQVSSNDDASDGEVGATSRPLTEEDIQQWASGVVQKCVRQVCRNRVPGEPSSPSQASDICAEKPSGFGVSQCPLAGLHCKLGAAALSEIPAPRTKEVRVTPPPMSSLSRKPLQVRNWRDIPEFVPRQLQVSTDRIEVPRKLDTRSAMNATRDAATRVIARMENQVGFSTQQWLVGTEKRMVNTAGGRQGTLRCA